MFVTNNVQLKILLIPKKSPLKKATEGILHMIQRYENETKEHSAEMVCCAGL